MSSSSGSSDGLVDSDKVVPFADAYACRGEPRWRHRFFERPYVRVGRVFATFPTASSHDGRRADYRSRNRQRRARRTRDRPLATDTRTGGNRLPTRIELSAEHRHTPTVNQPSTRAEQTRILEPDLKNQQ